MHFSKLAALAFVLASPLGCAESGVIDPIGAGGVGAGSSHKPPNGGSSGTTPKGGTGGGGTGGTTTGGTAGAGAVGGTSGSGGSSGSSGTAGSSGSGGTAGSSGSAGEAGAGGAGGTCVGTALPCADLGASDCAVSSGCTLAAACNNLVCGSAQDDVAACILLMVWGCGFDNTKPTGNQCFATACAGGTDAASCAALAGCTFTGSCSGTPDDCATLGRTACKNQLGCSWE